MLKCVKFDHGKTGFDHHCDHFQLRGFVLLVRLKATLDLTSDKTKPRS